MMFQPVTGRIMPVSSGFQPGGSHFFYNDPGDGINAAGPPRLAAGDPVGRQDTAPDQSMHLQSFDGIGRTTGIMAAAFGEQGRNQVFVQIDYTYKWCYENLPHRSKIIKYPADKL